MTAATAYFAQYVVTISKRIVLLGQILMLISIDE